MLKYFGPMCLFTVLRLSPSNSGFFYYCFSTFSFVLFFSLIWSYRDLQKVSLTCQYPFWDSLCCPDVYVPKMIQIVFAANMVIWTRCWHELKKTYHWFKISNVGNSHKKHNFHQHSFLGERKYNLLESVYSLTICWNRSVV